MLKSGLVSISFRALSCEDIIALCKKSGLQGIEWGSDIHVPAGDIENAKRVRLLTEQAGLSVAAYGSYYKLGQYENDYLTVFEPYLQTAIALGAPMIRIWAGIKASSEVTEEQRRLMVCQARDIAELSRQHGVVLAFECHQNTLTDDYLSYKKLMQEINHDAFFMNWQPNQAKDFNYNRKALEIALPYLLNLHVFEWPNQTDKLPLRSGEEKWLSYLKIALSDDKDHWCLLEFMPDDKPQSLITEANTLNQWLQSLK